MYQQYLRLRVSVRQVELSMLYVTKKTVICSMAVGKWQNEMPLEEINDAPKTPLEAVYWALWYAAFSQGRRVG